MTGRVLLLPPDSTPLERAIADTARRLSEVDAEVVAAAAIADLCPPVLLPWLAWERSVDEWNDGWTTDQKRAVVAGSFDMHSVKGTRGALNRALAQLGHSAVLTEWFETGGAPYTFRLTLQVGGEADPPQSELDLLRRVAIKAKNVRSMLEIVWARHVAVRAPVHVAAWLARTARTVTIYPEGAFA